VIGVARIVPLVISCLLLVALPGFAGHRSGQDSSGAPRIIEISADDFAFTPATIHVRLHETVELQLTARDKTHGFRIKPIAEGASKGSAPGLSFLYAEDCYKMKKGDVVKVDFVANAPGTYRFECCKACGSGHKRMKGEILVDITQASGSDEPHAQ
jgi:heme/copper-type cytochrome/quinol oxidase subunit 2